jgi:DNA-binding SARP family transcriptional activator
MLRLKLFGAGEARYDGRLLAGFPNQQGCLLLCYLVLGRNRPHGRETLAAVFWGDYPTDVSRKHLSQALWRLRHALQSIGAPADDYLLTSKESISFSSSGCRAVRDNDCPLPGPGGAGLDPGTGGAVGRGH